LTGQFLGAGHGRPALDGRCGDGALARYVHGALGYRTTGIDCSSAVLEIAQAEQDTSDGPVLQQLDPTAPDRASIVELLLSIGRESVERDDGGIRSKGGVLGFLRGAGVREDLLAPHRHQLAADGGASGAKVRTPTT
jgi:hypothetical protein